MPESFGAIALCVRDFTAHSRYRAETTIIGGTSTQGFAGLNYHYMPPAKWYENRTRAYIRGCIRFINDNVVKVAEIHNRPHILRLFAGKVNCRLALHLHNDPQEMADARTPKERQRLLDSCAAVYCVSEYIRGRFLEGLDAKAKEKVHVIYNGLESPASLPEKENIIVFAGRMTEGKGALLLAQALRIALPLLPDWNAVLIGSRRHCVAVKLTAHEKEIMETLQPLGESVEMLGFLGHTETLGYFARAGIVVVPSIWDEPFGRTALEAMAYGCALISSRRGGLKEVTADAAVTLTILTPEKLAEAIVKLATDRHERGRLQTAARARAGHFSIAGCTKLLDKIREQIL